MKTLILAGGLGTRLSEETHIVPKPMVEIGNRPILWHIMKTYGHYGFREFVLLLGYRGDHIRDYFFNYFLHSSNVTLDLAERRIDVQDSLCEPWKVTLLETGADTMTGGRIRLARDQVNDQTFMLTYGDGVGDVNIEQLLAFHKKHRRLITMTVIRPEGRFGAVSINDEELVTQFNEKPKDNETWVNGGFFVCEPGVFDYIEDQGSIVFEHGPLERLAHDGQLGAYRHEGFWQCMDTLHDKVQLNELWGRGEAPWRVWDR